MSVRQGNKIIAGSAKAVGISIGTIFTAPYNNYTPEGAVLADGSEFDATQFPDLWKDYIQGGRLLTCTYQEFNADVAKSGGCAKFAVNGNKFKVPMVGNGTFIAGGNGESFAESLPNITTKFVSKGSISWAVIPTISNATGALNLDSQQGGQYSNVAPNNTGNAQNNYSFDASRCSSAYQDGAKVQPNNIRMRYYVQVASGSVNQSMMDWSKYMQGLEGKANTDADNLSALGRGLIAGLAMPSDKFIDLTVEASTTKYTAPANGYFVFTAFCNSCDVFLDTSLGACFLPRQDRFVRATVPCRKGSKVTVVYDSTNFQALEFRFVFAEGEI